MKLTPVGLRPRYENEKWNETQGEDEDCEFRPDKEKNKNGFRPVSRQVQE